MKDVKYLCEDVHKTAIMLPINFHSQQHKPSPLLPSQSRQRRLSAGSEAAAACTQREKLALSTTGTTSHIDFEVAFCQLTSMRVILFASVRVDWDPTKYFLKPLNALSKKRGIENKGSPSAGPSWGKTSCWCIGNKYRQTRLLWKNSLSLRSELYTVMVNSSA